MDEREQFEAYWVREVPERYRAETLKSLRDSRRKNGSYNITMAAHAWEAWKARANLASGQSAENRGEAEQIVANWVKSRGTSMNGEAYAAAVELVTFAQSQTADPIATPPQASADDVLSLRQLEAGMRAIADSIGPICTSKMNAAIAAERASTDTKGKDRG